MKFDDAFEVQSDGGRRVKKKDYRGDGILPVIDQGEVFVGGFTDDVGMAYDGPLPVIVFGDHTRRVKHVEHAFAVGAEGVKLLSPTDDFDSRFLAYHLLAFPVDDRGYGRHFQYLRKLTFISPPLAEQSQLVARIDELFSDVDAGVAALERARANLKRYRAAVLKAAVEGKPIGEKGAKSVEAAWVPIKAVITGLDQGWSPKCDRVSAGLDEWGVIKTTAVQPMGYLSNENKRLPDGLEPRPDLEVMPGDLLITRAGPRSRCGVVCLVRETRPKLMVCDKVYRIRCRDDLVRPAYLELVLNSLPLQKAIGALKTGISDSGVNLTQGRLQSLEIPVPSLRTQDALIGAVEALETTNTTLDRSIAEAVARSARLKQSVLRAAFAGELQSDSDA